MEGHVTNPEPPSIPERIRRLPELALDLWWTWNPQAREVFRRLDYPLWRQTAHNPVLMLKLVSPDLLAQAASDEFLASTTALAALDAARSARETWWLAGSPRPRARLRTSPPSRAAPVAPDLRRRPGSSCGDHCKEASDLGIPLIGVGFMYPQGYFHQAVSPEGWQQEIYERLDWTDAPIERRRSPRRQPLHRRGSAGRSHGAGGGVASAARAG